MKHAVFFATARVIKSVDFHDGNMSKCKCKCKSTNKLVGVNLKAYTFPELYVSIDYRFQNDYFNTCSAYRTPFTGATYAKFLYMLWFEHPYTKDTVKCTLIFFRVLHTMRCVLIKQLGP